MFEWSSFQSCIRSHFSVWGLLIKYAACVAVRDQSVTVLLHQGLPGQKLRLECRCFQVQKWLSSFWHKSDLSSNGDRTSSRKMQIHVSALQDSCMRFYIWRFSACHINNFNSNIFLRKILVILVLKKLIMNKKNSSISTFKGKWISCHHHWYNHWKTSADQQAKLQ